jgi:hypothetical protein
MGILNQIGTTATQMLVPGTSAQSLADASITRGAVGTGMEAGGDLLQGVGGYQQALYQAKLAGRNAENVQASGDYQEEASKMRYGALGAQQKADAAARGVSVDSTSVANTLKSTAEIGGLDAAMIHFNAMREAYGLTSQAAVDKAAGRNAAVGGILKAGTSFLSGAQSVSDKWLAYQRSGAMVGA